MSLCRLIVLALAAHTLPVEAAVAVIDDADRRVELSAPARRIISLSPALTESLFAAGGGPRLVATVAASDYPPSARHVPRLGDAANLSLEALVARRPDLVLVWRSGNPPRLVARLRELGIPVYVSEVRSLDGVAETLEELGILAGEPRRGRAAAAEFRLGLDALRRRYGDAAPLRVFYQVWPQPLITVGGPHLISRALELCGGQNVFGEFDHLAPKVTVEAVLARDPEVIVAAGAEGAADPLAPWAAWPELRAVRAHNLITIDADLLHRPTPRLLDGARHLCRALHEIRTTSGAQKR